MESEKYQLNKKDGLKILKGLAIAMGGAVLTFATEMIPQVEWGQWTPVVVAASSVLINAVWKWIK